MKRLIMLIGLVLILGACGGKVHKNISQEMAGDTEQILTIFEQNIKEDRGLTEREEKIFDEYKVKYGAKANAPDFLKVDFSEEEHRLFLLTRNLIDMHGFYTTLKSDHEKFDGAKRNIKSVIKSGQVGG